MIRAYVYDSYPMGGFSVGISLVMLPPEGSPDVRPRVLRLGASGNASTSAWDEVPPDLLLGDPTMTLDGEAARALLDGLTRHFQGAEDTRALRRDYDAERKRVDDLTGHLAAIARTLSET